MCGRQGECCPVCHQPVPWGLCPHCRQVTVMRMAAVPVIVRAGTWAQVGWFPDCCGQWLPRAAPQSTGWMVEPDPVDGRPAAVRRVQHLSRFRVGGHEQDGPVYLDGVGG